MIKIVEGNILDAKEDIIVHQVNCMGVMGSGIAHQLRKKYPKIYEDYYNFVCNAGNNKNLLSQICTSKCYDGKYIVHLFGQESYGNDGARYTNYEAFSLAFYKLIWDCILTKGHRLEGLSVAIPYGIGCGLGGGDWNKIFRIIKDVCSEDAENIDVVIYKLI